MSRDKQKRSNLKINSCCGPMPIHDDQGFLNILPEKYGTDFLWRSLFEFGCPIFTDKTDSISHVIYERLVANPKIARDRKKFLWRSIRGGNRTDTKCPF